MTPSLVIGLVLSSVLSSAYAEALPLTYEFRPLRAESDYQTLDRSSILYGPTGFRVAAVAPYRVVGFTIVDEGRNQQAGEDHVLCRSSDPSNVCRVDFGEIISRRTLRIDAEVRGSEGDTVVSERFITLDAHSRGGATAAGATVPVERRSTAAIPPERLKRLVRLETVQGKGDDKRIVYRDDLTRDSFLVKVAGIREARILSVQPPDPERPKLIPILFNVAPHLTMRAHDHPGFGWSDTYGTMVSTLVEGLRVAANRGVDVEYVVVAYAATGRVFGPFRLHPGPDLDETRRPLNEEILETLRHFLEEPPLPQWQKKFKERWVDNFNSTIHTLNDLYLQDYDGLVQAVWITNGGSNPSSLSYQFQKGMWPERLEELNTEWSDARLLELLKQLDAGKGVRDEAMVEFIELLGDYSPPTAGRMRTFLSELDPEGNETLQTRRADSSPMLNVLLNVLSTPSVLRWADGRHVRRRVSRTTNFPAAVQRRYGGQVFSLHEGAESVEHRAPLVSGPVTVAQVLQRTYEQLVHSYVIDIEVASPRGSRSRHNLRFDAVEKRTGEKTARLPRFELAYMPYYKPPGSVRNRLVYYLHSGFKDLRLLSAYELRNHWFGEDILRAWAERWQMEDDDQVRSILFESWVSINLKRLQASGSTRRGQKRAKVAYEKLRRAGDLAEHLANPTLAHGAADVAEWYRVDHREVFGD